MNQKALGKTILNVYGCLEKITDGIDRLVLSFGMNSCLTKDNFETMSVAQRMIALTNRKINLINLKLLTEQCISELDIESKKIIMLYFVDKVGAEVIMKTMGFSRRTFFRKKDKAIESFGKKIFIEGSTSGKLFKCLQNEEWIKEIYKKNCEQAGIDCNTGDLNILQYAFADFKKIKVNNCLYY